MLEPQIKADVLRRLREIEQQVRHLILMVTEDDTAIALLQETCAVQDSLKAIDLWDGSFFQGNRLRLFHCCGNSIAGLARSDTRAPAPHGQV